MRQVEVRTPSRLHFGLFAFAGSPWAFGGVGVAIADPCVQLSLTPADEFAVDRSDRASLYADRIQDFAVKFTAAQDAELPSCQIKVQAAPPQHVGLGLGTQLALAVAAGIDAYQTGAVREVEQLGAAVGRGRRSAVGTHTFDQGGLVIDRGQSGEEASRLEATRIMPSDWRLLLLRPADAAGLSGQQESSAFDKLPGPPQAVTAELRRLALEEMLPALGDHSPTTSGGFVEENDAAANAADYAKFAAALGEYGELAGNCFAEVQGGPFASPAIAELIGAVRSLGFAGCGQSSWGPTVYVLTPSESEAETLAKHLLVDDRFASLHATITAADNQGAVITIDED